MYIDRNPISLMLICLLIVLNLWDILGYELFLLSDNMVFPIYTFGVTISFPPFFGSNGFNPLDGSLLKVASTTNQMF